METKFRIEDCGIIGGLGAAGNLQRHKIAFKCECGLISGIAFEDESLYKSLLKGSIEEVLKDLGWQGHVCSSL